MTKIGFVHNAYPVLSQTFITKEMLGLQKLGLAIQIYSLLLPRDDQKCDKAQADGVQYVLPQVRKRQLFLSHLYFMFASPHRYWPTLLFVLKRRVHTVLFFKSMIAFVREKETSKEQRQDLLIHFLLSPVLAKKMKKDGITFVNSHFADAAAAFSMISARLLGLAYGVTTHAYDIFTAQYNLSEKLENAQFVLTCTGYNKKALFENLKINDRKIHVYYHGIDTTKFTRTDRKPKTHVEIFSVGRLVPKKGFDILIRACALLCETGLVFKCRIVGDGPLYDILRQKIESFGLKKTVELVGALPPDRIKAYYERADIFALPCIIEENGNRDGIPNVIAEAMAMELPVVSSKISAIPELVEDGVTGYLHEQRDVQGVANALQLLSRDKNRRHQMGSAGRHRVKSIFDSQICLQNLHDFYIKELGNNGKAT